MRNYTEEQLKENYDKFIGVIKANFKDERLEKLLNLYNEDNYGLVLMTAPASSKDYFHSAYTGGYLDHVLNVIKASYGAKKYYEIMGCTIDFTDEELIFSAMHHDLGKLGIKEFGEYYINQDSEWHRKNQGDIFKINPDVPHMTVTDRTFFLLQQYQITCTWKETLGIKLADGLYEEANKEYLRAYNKSSILRTNLPRVLHVADAVSATSERDNWVLENI